MSSSELAGYQLQAFLATVPTYRAPSQRYLEATPKNQEPLPILGEFGARIDVTIQLDPTWFGSVNMNLYEYCGASPVTTIDASGLIGQGPNWATICPNSLCHCPPAVNTCEQSNAGCPDPVCITDTGHTHGGDDPHKHYLVYNQSPPPACECYGQRISERNFLRGMAVN